MEKGRWQVSPNGGNSPLWSRTGRELFYRNGDAVLETLVKTDPGFRVDAPKLLFRGAYSFGGVSSSFSMTEVFSRVSWDISPDGKRFLMMKESSPASAGEGPRKINIVLNWFEELKQRVPVP